MGRAMAGNSHEDPGEDAEGEGKVVRTRNRHASCGEELPSHCPSSSAPSGAAARRLSLPTAMPAPQDSLAAPVPEYNPRPREAVLSIEMFAPQSGSWYSACPHRAHLCEGGPPCYMCSVLDVPPKYHRREARGWRRFREKLAQLSHGTSSSVEGGRPREQDSTAAVFTVSEWRPRDPPGAVRAEEVPVSLNAAPGDGGAQERDNPAFDAQNSLEGGEARGAQWGVAPQLPPASASINIEGVSFVPLPPSLPSSAFGQMSPPPYSPPIVTNGCMPPYFPPEDVPEAAATSRCNRRLVCQLLYSFLLATASSTLIVSYDQPILVITSVIVFLALFVFMPIIVIIECIFRCKMEQDFRQYLHTVITTSAPSLNPLII